LVILVYEINVAKVFLWEGGEGGGCECGRKGGRVDVGGRGGRVGMCVLVSWKCTSVGGA